MPTPPASPQFELTTDSRGGILPSPVLLKQFCVLFMAMTTIPFFAGWLLSPPEMLFSSAVFTAVYLALFIWSWYLATRGRVRLGTHILVVGNYLGMVSMLIVSEQFVIPAVSATFGILLVSGFLLRHRDAVIASTISASTILTFTWARAEGWLPPSLMILPVTTTIITYCTTFVSTCSLVYLGLEHLNNVVLLAWENKVKLHESIEALKVARGTEERRAGRAERLGAMARSLVELREVEGIAQEVTISLREALDASIVVALGRGGRMLASAGLGASEPPVSMLTERIDRLVADENFVVLDSAILKQCAEDLSLDHLEVGLAARCSHTAVTILVFGADKSALGRGEGGWSLQAAVNIMDGTIIRHESERRFVQSQQMDAVGRLSAGIAHEFNNLLTTIMGCIELVEHQVQVDDPVRGHLRRIQAAGKRAESLTSQLMSFTHGESRSPETLEVGGFLASLIPMYRRTIEESIQVEFHEMEEKAWVTLVPSELERILFNLLANARDALGDHGRIDIGVEVRNDGGEGLSRLGDVVIWIQDNGDAMEAEILSRVLEPFFTLREGKGSVGLGLSIVSSAVEASGGELFVDSTKESGTCFEIHFPVKAEPVSAPVSPRSPVAEGRLVLVVEDDSEVRETLCEMLTLLGYDVVSVGTGIQALKELASSQHFSMVLSDIVMPEMGGFELVAQMAAAGISVPIVLISGYAPGDVLPDVDTSDIQRLSKPFTLGALRAVLASNMTA
jgi:signal transduction histidine kinase/CheY-like chemotaxis protein